MPKDRIARIKSYFAEDNAVTSDGLLYPKEAIDALLVSIHQQLADPNGLPIPCYLSHDDADSGNIAHLVGKVSGAGREGSKGYVWVDVPDTQAGREMLTLARGKYITSQSMRGSGSEMRPSKDGSVRIISGKNLRFEGIDWTTRPRLKHVARIADITESYHSILIEEELMYPQNNRRPQSIKESVRETLNDESLAEALLDRSRPLPEPYASNPERAVEELKLVYLGLYDAEYGLTSLPQRHLYQEQYERTRMREQTEQRARYLAETYGRKR